MLKEIYTKNSKTEIGKNGEDLAVDYLKSKDHIIIQRNFHTTYGEIDVISMKSKTIYFYEVKYRKFVLYGTGESSITKSKIQKLQKSIEVWVTKEGRKYSYSNLYLNALAIDADGKIFEFEIC